MKNVTFFALALAMTLIAAPVFAADTGQDEFAAIRSMASDVNPLSDEQLAKVEGGNHLSAAVQLLQIAADFATFTGGFDVVNLTVANQLRIAAANALLGTPVHAGCSGINLGASGC